MPMFFAVAGLAGQSLAPSSCLATLPISFLVIGSMVFSAPLSNFMQKHGRRAGFTLGTVGGGTGAAICSWGLLSSSFMLFCLGSFITGLYMSAQGFYRFAATDNAPDAFQPKAISWVMAGGLAAAVFGSQLAKYGAYLFVIPFLGTYLIMMALNIFGSFIFWGLSIPKPPPAPKNAAPKRSWGKMLKTPPILIAILCATISYALMNLVMTSSPLAIVGCGYGTSNAADVVGAHVLAMYIPSFFTGSLIARFGCEKIIALGLLIIAASAGIALSGLQLEHFFVSQILLGLGWNFGFIGSTALLTKLQTPQERGSIQGLNDLVVFGGVSLASLVSGGLMNCSTETVGEGWQLINIATIPFLTIAALALGWLYWRKANKKTI